MRILLTIRLAPLIYYDLNFQGAVDALVALTAMRAATGRGGAAAGVPALRRLRARAAELFAASTADENGAAAPAAATRVGPMPSLATEDGALGAALRARGVRVGARLRMRRGVATLLGVGHVRGGVWYVVDSSNDSEKAWYWTPADLLEGLNSGAITLLPEASGREGSAGHVPPTSPGARFMHAWLSGVAGGTTGATAGELVVAFESEGEGEGEGEGKSTDASAPSAALPPLTFDALLHSVGEQWSQSDDEALVAFADAKCDELGVAMGALRPRNFEVYAADVATPATSALAIFARFCESRALNELIACALPLVDFSARASHATAALVAARQMLFRGTKQYFWRAMLRATTGA